MQKHRIVVGSTYRATVSGKDARVRITSHHPSGKGWWAINIATGHEVRIVTAGRLHPLPFEERAVQETIQ